MKPIKAEYLFEGVYINADGKEETKSILVLTIDYQLKKFSVNPYKKIVDDGKVYRVESNLQDADFLMTMLSTSIKAIKFAKKELSEHAINKSKELKDI
jgi:intein-encoded DNA endonuclease-like protein